MAEMRHTLMPGPLTHVLLSLIGAIAAILFSVTTVFAQAQHEGREAVDLQLVLAVDSSGSIDMMDFQLQLDGIAAAMRDTDVLSAIESGFHGKIAVSLVLWSDPERPRFATPWFIVADGNSADDFASVVENLQRHGGGGTGIGRALEYAIRHFDSSPAIGGRMVIDISGDGPEILFGPNSVRPDDAQELAQVRNVTINGLVILTDHPDLERFYRDKVIVGDDAFVMSIESLDDFKDAMRRKLLREILPSVYWQEQKPAILALTQQ